MKNIIKKILKEEEIRLPQNIQIVKSSDLNVNWSPGYQIKIKQGKLPYIIQNNQLIPVDLKKTIPYKGLYWFTPEEFERINQVGEELNIKIDLFKSLLSGS